MQQKDQENSVTPKKHWKALTQGSGGTNSSTSSPSVASRSAAFENNERDEQKVKNVFWPYLFYGNCQVIIFAVALLKELQKFWSIKAKDEQFIYYHGGQD